MAKINADAYVNHIQGTFNVTNTTTASQKIDLGYGILDRTVMLVSRIEWTADDDTGWIAQGTRRKLFLAAREFTTEPTLDNVSVHAMSEVKMIGETASIVANAHPYPMKADYTALKGGGLLIPARPLWVGATNFGSTDTDVYWRLYFTLLEADDATYIEMLQSAGVFGGV